jgi:hypothetical protein
VPSAKESARDVVAVHEAGHAVAGVLAGARLVTIELKTRWKKDGSSSYTLPQLEVRQTRSRNVKISLSGRVAQDIYLRHRPSRSVSFTEVADDENYTLGDFTAAVYQARRLVDFETVCLTGSLPRVREMQ